MSSNQSHKSGMNGFGGMSSGLSSAPRMGSSGGTGSSAAGGFGSRSGGAGQHGAGGSTMGSATGGSQSLGSPTGSSGSQSGSQGGSSGNKTPAPKLQSASKATAGSSSHSLYDYNYGAGDSGRTADSIYKSKDEAAPTDNYKWGATDLR